MTKSIPSIPDPTTPTTATHTPGPWRFEASTKTIRSVPANYWLASLDSWDGAVNHEANARLLAAAPELLAMLKELRDSAMNTPVLDSSAEWTALIEKADAVMAKATQL